MPGATPAALFTVFLMFFVMSVGPKGTPDRLAGAASERADLLAEAKAPAPPWRPPHRPPSPVDAKRRTQVDTGSAKLDAAIRHAIDNPELALCKLKGTAYKFSFLLVPISLPFLWLVFFWRRRAPARSLWPDR